MTGDQADGAGELAPRLLDQLLAAIASRDIIGMAKGIVMEREDMTEEEAFRMLVTVSQRQNNKLRDVARHLVNEREERSRAQGQ